MSYLVPLIFICVMLCGVAKRVNVFSSFTRGAGEGLQFVISILPLLAAVFMMCELMEVSGISQAMTTLLAPLFAAVGIPKEICKLVLIKPFSGSGSLTYLTNIIKTYGADSYIARCACVCYGSSETVFYISAVYFAKSKVKKRTAAIFLILFSSFISTIFGCFLCKFV